MFYCVTLGKLIIREQLDLGSLFTHLIQNTLFAQGCLSQIHRIIMV